jgi:hypothetical protein
MRRRIGSKECSLFVLKSQALHLRLVELSIRIRQHADDIIADLGNGVALLAEPAIVDDLEPVAVLEDQRLVVLG